MSGVEVATTIRSTSALVRPALASAQRHASSARSLVDSWSAAMWRSRMPVRSTIHASLVSTTDASSALVMIFSGR